MSKERLSGWRPREESWEETVLSWDEQMTDSSLLQKLSEAAGSPVRVPWRPPPDYEEIEAARISTLPPDH